MLPLFLSALNRKPSLETINMYSPEIIGRILVPNGISQLVLPVNVFIDVVIFDELRKISSSLIITDEDRKRPNSSEEVASTNVFNQLIL